jgi:uncharacterized protein (TIGR02444 family)
VEFPEHPFWDFSLQVYMTEGVSTACLELQTALHVDVNIVMFCLWNGATGRGALTAAEIAAATEAVGPWHERVVKGLRAVRQTMKGGLPPAPVEQSEPLRRRIAKIEVDCEHLEQLMLAAAVDRPVDPARTAEQRAADAAANVAHYLRAIGARAGAGHAATLATILKVAFREVPAARIEAICRNAVAA